jgi:hypothetical protein
MHQSHTRDVGVRANVREGFLVALLWIAPPRPRAAGPGRGHDSSLGLLQQLVADTLVRRLEHRLRHGVQLRHTGSRAARQVHAWPYALPEQRITHG